jgi:predicted phage tail protein
MKHIKKYIEKKSHLKGRGGGGGGSAGGDVYLRPPPAGTNLFQSNSFLTCLDLVSEGPIEGPVKRDGSTARGIDILEAVYYDQTAVKDGSLTASNNVYDLLKGFFSVDRVSVAAIENSIDYTSGQLNNASLEGIFETNANRYIDVLYDDVLPIIQDSSNSLDYSGYLGVVTFPMNGYFGGQIANHSGGFNYDVQDYNFNLNINRKTFTRTVKADNGSDIVIPEPAIFAVPDFTTGTNIFQNFYGAGYLFFYIGNEVATGLGGEFLTGKFLVNSSDVDIDDKIQSGIDNNYDVFVYDNNSFSFGHAVTQNNTEKGDLVGEKIEIHCKYAQQNFFNYSTSQVDFNYGLENQEPLANFENVEIETVVNTILLGPLTFSGGSAAGGDGNDDIRDGGNFATWAFSASSPAHDEYPYTHVIQNPDVTSCKPVVSINFLQDTEANDDETLGRSLAETVTFRIEMGFEGADRTQTGLTLTEKLNLGLNPREIYFSQFTVTQNVQFNGICTSPYIIDLDLVIDIPDNIQLRDATIADITGMNSTIASAFGLNLTDKLFAGKTWKNINRYMRVSKVQNETQSVLIKRNIALFAVVEIINESFNYPSSALFSNTIDARTFQNIPERSYDLRLKKVLVPSNYNPLDAAGLDKRFIEDSSSYGLKNIQTFDGLTHAVARDAISLGSENCEFSVKFKLGSFTDFSRIFDAEDSSGPIISLYPRFTDFRLALKDGFGSTNYIDIDISSYQNINNIFEVRVKFIGSKITLTVFVNGVNIGSQAATETRRPIDIVVGGFGIGGTAAGTNQVPSGTKIVDLKIKKNNQLLNFWDGTVVDTTRVGNCMKDRFGGNHADIIGTTNTVEDTNFELGRSKQSIYHGVWDGSLKLAWTDNPAWILYDLMVNPIYGIGSMLDDLEDIDIFKLYEISKYCDGVDEDGYFDGVPDAFGGIEPRFSCNILLKEKKNAFEVLGNMASIFRSIAYWEAGSFNFSIDSPKEVTAIFNNQNVLDGLFNYADIASTARFTRVEVFYADAKDNYTLKKEYVEDEDGIRRYGIISHEANGIGCTSKSQAKRMGKYILLSNKLETETISFRAGQEAVFLSPGSIVRVDDELKNFEINYGNILDVNTGVGYVSIEKHIKTGSIVTGINEGGIYLQTNKKQEEIKDLYDVVNFNKNYQYGEDLDVYSGRLNDERIANISNSPIDKFYITGITENQNHINLYLGTGQEGYEYLTGVRPGSTFNIELKNNVSEFYKVTKVSEVEQNIYEIQGLEYDPDKFSFIEGEDFDIVDTGYNIGIPQIQINRPPAPQGFTANVSRNSVGSFDINGTITGAIGGNELKYRVSVTSPNGKYLTQDFLKDDSLTPPQTVYKIANVETAGTYDVRVTSLRNPESSLELKTEVDINQTKEVVMERFSISNISIATSSTQSFDGGIGEGIQTTRDMIFDFELTDYYGDSLSFYDSEAPRLKITLCDDSWGHLYVLSQSHQNHRFIFKKEENLKFFTEIKRNYNLKFELFDKYNKLHDVAKYKIKNLIPTIEGIRVKDGILGTEDAIQFEIISPSFEDIDYIQIMASDNPVDGFKPIMKEVAQPVLRLDKSYLLEGAGYNTGMMYYKAVPVDDYGSGLSSDLASGALVLSKNLWTTISENPIKCVYVGKGNENLTISESSNDSSGFYAKTGDVKKYLIDWDINVSPSTGQSYYNLKVGSGIVLDSITFSGNQEEYKSSKSYFQPEEEKNQFFWLETSGDSGHSVNEFSITAYSVSNKL